MIVSVYKPAGWSSFDVVRKIRSISGEKKVGHGGTLDPFAEGVLVLALGPSTKLLSMIMSQEKEYEAVLELGSETDTLDIYGQVVKTLPVPPLTEYLIREVFDQFVGTISQIPPMYSAKKVNGKRLYTLARKNIEIERHPVRVIIRSISLIDFARNSIHFLVTCSKGTYVRQLGADIADALGTVGHLSFLKRTRTGSYTVENCISIEDFEKEWLSTAA